MNDILKAGDIVAFKAGNDWLSKAIAWFTQTDVSHTAMAYSEDSIVEMGAYGIGVHKIDISGGDSVYVMRLTSILDAAPLIRSADAYINTKIRYDFPALFILAGLLIYKRIVPTSPLLKITNLILSSACTALDKMLNNILYQSSAPTMICSQLVYQIYYDCGSEYRILIENGCVFNSPIEEGTPNSVRLIDLVGSGNHPAQPAILISSPLENIAMFDTIMKEFYELLCSSEQDAGDNRTLIDISAREMDNTLALTARFLDLVERLLEITGYDMPPESLFVTPGDLVYHALNLENKGTVNLQRLLVAKDFIFKN